jgi:hypothetical protein
MPRGVGGKSADGQPFGQALSNNTSTFKLRGRVLNTFRFRGLRPTGYFSRTEGKAKTRDEIHFVEAIVTILYFYSLYIYNNPGVFLF